MRVEVVYERRVEVFDTDRFTEAQPFSGRSMLADFELVYREVEERGLWLSIHCYAANEEYRADADGVPEARREKGWRFQLATSKEVSEIETVSMDGSTVLARLYGELVDVANVDRLCALFAGPGGSVANRIARLSEYLANSDEALAASSALMAKAIGVKPDVLERALACEAAQEISSDDEEGSWMEGYGYD